MMNAMKNVISYKNKYHTIIIGGGVMGSSIAFQLAKMGVKDVAVVERDNTYTYASSALSACGIRQQFALPENILLSKYGGEFIRNPEALTLHDGSPLDFQFFRHGYLFLRNSGGVEQLKINHQMQRKCGVENIHLHTPEKLKELYPWLEITNPNCHHTADQDIALGSCSFNGLEGYFDPWSYLSALRKKNIELGVEYIDAECGHVSMGVANNRYQIRSVDVISSNSNIKNNRNSRLIADCYVNAAGAWSSNVMNLMISNATKTCSQGVSGGTSSLNPKNIKKLPVEARKRCVFMVDCAVPTDRPDIVTPPRNTPLTVDTSGIWFRPEGQSPTCNNFIMGVSPNEGDDPHSVTTRDLEQIDYELYEETIWPTLAGRIPAFEYLKLKSAWAGYYEHNTFDHNGIMGYHTDISNLVLCTGFSGHGLQQSPAAGLVVAEMIVNSNNRSHTIDVAKLGFERIANNEPYFEDKVAIV